MGRYETEALHRCSSQPLLVLSAQSEAAAGYFGRDRAVQAIHAFSEQCRTNTEFTQATPGCIVISEADVARLLTIVPDGTPVTFRD